MATHRIRRSKNLTRKTGGKPFKNVLANIGNLRKDRNVKKHYYETQIEVDGKKYKINYFTPSNKILKTTDSTFIIPKFNLRVNRDKPKDYSLKIDGAIHINSIIILNKSWYVITRTFDNIKKQKSTYFYKIQDVFKRVGNDELQVDPRKCTIANGAITIHSANITQVNEGDEYFNILAHFDNQQFVGEAVKEGIAVEAGLLAAEGLF